MSPWRLRQKAIFRDSLNIGLLITGLVLPGQGSGLSSDSEQPIQIEADFGELDDRTQVTTYTGNVVATQGTLRLTGDVMTIHYSEDQEIEKIKMIGEPAHLKQRMDGHAVDTEGDALTIEYYTNDSLLVLIENAKAWQGDKRFSGDRIDYDMIKKILKVRNGPSNDRIKVIIPPKKKDEQ